MWQIKKLLKYEQNFDFIAILSITVFLILAIFVPSVKVFFVLAFALFGFLSFYYSFPKALIYSTIPLTYVNLAQIHSILVVPAKAITSNQYWEGRHITFGFSPYFFIASIALIMIFFWFKKFKHQKKLANYEKMLIVLFGCGFLSAIYSSLMVGLSIFSVFSKLTSVVWVWYLGRLLGNSKQKNQQKIVLTMFLITALIIVYESLIVFKQTYSQSPIGLAIEKTEFSPSFGSGADENGGGFRPFGLQAHPNGLANSQLIMVFSAWLLYSKLDSKNKKNKTMQLKKILVLIFCLTTINIILSLSRAAFIAIFLAIGLLYIRHKKQFLLIINKIKKQADEVPLRNKIILIAISSLLIFKLSNRMLNSIYSFTEFGGISTRSIQYAEAIEVFKKSPIFGIGDEMFIPTSYQLFPKGVMTYFPENVHNGYLLFLIERGLLGMTAYAVFLLLLLQKIRQSSLNRSIKSIVYSGLIASFAIMLFHPERNFLSNFLLLVMAINNLNYEKN